MKAFNLLYSYIFRKQGLLCYQGNIFRAEKDNCKNNNYTTSQIQTRSTKNTKKKDGVSDILSKVEQVHIDDRSHLTDSNNTRSRKEKVCFMLLLCQKIFSLIHHLKYIYQLIIGNFI